MNRLIFSLSAAVVAQATLVATPSGAQSTRIPDPFSSGAPAAMPASPLAGGMPATAGGSYMDVYGNPIVLPAQYCAPDQAYGACPPGAGDGLYADFGGYSMPDQVGPHYFDVSAEAVFLRPDGLLDGIGPLSTIGLGNTDDTLPSPATGLNDYEAGWRIALRYDLGPLSVLEATYTGLYDIGFTSSVTAENNDLFSAFSNFGLNNTFLELDNASVHRFSYDSDLQSTEFTYRRYWVGANPRISGTLLTGFRYVRMTEQMAFFGSGLNGSGTIALNSENDLLGGQFGGDGWIGLRQGLRFGVEGKAGVYNNRFKLAKTGVFSAATPDFVAAAEGNQVAFVGESRALLVADILPSWSLRGGYEVLYISSLATVGSNLSTTAPSSILVNSQGDALYHGFTAGFEYVW